MKKIFASLIICLFAGSVSATTITADAGWYGFCFGGVGSGATAGCQNDATAGTAGNTMDLTLTGDALLKVTDAFAIGDVFDVWIDSVLAFTTGAFDLTGTTGVTDPDTAFDGSTFSSGSILLGAGTYAIDIIVAASPHGSGGAYVEVASVPEPASLALLGLGLAGLGLARKKAKA